MKESMDNISQGKKIEMDVCPHCGPLEGGPHPLSDCPYREESEEKTVLPAETAEAPSEKEKEMTPEEEKKFKEELLKRAKPFEETIAASVPAVEILKQAEIPKSEEPRYPPAVGQAGVFEELFAGAAKAETPVVEKQAPPKPKEIIPPAVEEKEIVPPPAEIKATKEEVLPPKPAAVEVKEPKKELKKEEIAANAIVAAVEMARDFISAGSAKITEEQAEKAALAALKDWERITTGMTVDERFKTFSAAEQAILDKIPEGKILKKLKEKIYVVMNPVRNTNS